eukprot:TRINITY_DN15441_c0_g1_i2.p3 TRINITY_DN15441_c0_g1~~TRINITY_DN15441_c0_g1_i2.p3  ORF type:complete len:168 (+),score=53.31 TRINITY_DN15441_c0_g1_i2:1362-1865(+)
MCAWAREAGAAEVSRCEALPAPAAADGGSSWQLRPAPGEPLGGRRFAVALCEVDHGYADAVGIALALATTLQGGAEAKRRRGEAGDAPAAGHWGLADGAWVVSGLKLGSLARRQRARRLKQFHEEVSWRLGRSGECTAQCRPLHLVHLVTEKESERTLFAQLHSPET